MSSGKLRADLAVTSLHIAKYRQVLLEKLRLFLNAIPVAVQVLVIPMTTSAKAVDGLAVLQLVDCDSR